MSSEAPCQRHLVPANQPTSVREIAARLFPAYQLDHGSAHLAGCLLEDRYFLRVRLHGDQRHWELFVDPDGDPLDRQAVEQLGMAETVFAEGAPDLPESRIEQGAQTATRRFVEEHPEAADARLVEFDPVACKYTEGKIRFTFGDSVADLPFAGWTRTLVASPYVCPYTGAEGYALAATDDGRITVAEQIAQCEKTGRRVLQSDLVACSVSGSRVLREELVECPVLGEPLLPERLVTCAMCHQSVSPVCVRRGKCQACRTVAPVGPEDARLRRLLEVWPAAGAERSWRVSETSRAVIFTTATWLRREVVVVDRETYALLWAGVRNRLGGAWTRWQMSDSE